MITMGRRGIVLWGCRIRFHNIIGPRLPVLEEEEDEGIPHEILDHGELDNKVLSHLPVHGPHHGDPDYQNVGETAEGEGGDSAAESVISPTAQLHPSPSCKQGDDLGDGVGGNEGVRHVEGVNTGGEVEGECGEDKEADETVDALAVVLGEEPPPLYGGVAEEESHVERGH